LIHAHLPFPISRFAAKVDDLASDQGGVAIRFFQPSHQVWMEKSRKSNVPLDFAA
jgi:hypothetical protein